jgi:hypothetical protein
LCGKTASRASSLQYYIIAGMHTRQA